MLIFRTYRNHYLGQFQKIELLRIQLYPKKITFPTKNPIFSAPSGRNWNVSAYHQENFLRILKLTLILFLVPFLISYGPFKHRSNFLGHPVLSLSNDSFSSGTNNSSPKWFIPGLYQNFGMTHIPTRRSI